MSDNHNIPFTDKGDYTMDAVGGTELLQDSRVGVELPLVIIHVFYSIVIAYIKMYMYQN